MNLLANNLTIKATDKKLIFLWTSPTFPHHMHATCKILTNLLIQPYDYFYSLQFKLVNLYGLESSLTLHHEYASYDTARCWEYLICFKAILQPHFDKFCSEIKAK